MNALKSEEIKFRVDPLRKAALKQICDEDQLGFSAIVRRAVDEMIARRSKQPVPPRPEHYGR